MWIASKHGFFSIVQKPDGFHVRARAKRDLVNLRRAASLQAYRLRRWPKADYRWRMIVPKEHLEEIGRALFASIDYPNFKALIAALPDQQDKLDAYHDIWLRMALLEGKMKALPASMPTSK